MTKASTPMWLLLALMILHPNTIKPIIPVGNSTASLLYLGPAVLALIGIAMCFNTFDETPLLMVLAAVILGFAASGVSWVRPAVVDRHLRVDLGESAAILRAPGHLTRSRGFAWAEWLDRGLHR